MFQCVCHTRVTMCVLLFPQRVLGLASDCLCRACLANCLGLAALPLAFPPARLRRKGHPRPVRVKTDWERKDGESGMRRENRWARTMELLGFWLLPISVIVFMCECAKRLRIETSDMNMDAVESVYITDATVWVCFKDGSVQMSHFLSFDHQPVMKALFCQVFWSY